MTGPARGAKTGGRKLIAPAALAALLALPALTGCATPPEEIEELRAEDSEDRIEAAVLLAERIVAADPEYVEFRRESVAALRALLDDRSALVRQVAIDALAKVEGRGAAQAIADRLRDKDPWVRLAAVKSLGALEARTTVDAIASRLRQDGADAEESPDVRRAAAQVLGKLKAESALRELYGALADRVPAVRYAAYLALKAITNEDHGEDQKAWRERAFRGHTE